MITSKEGEIIGAMNKAIEAFESGDADRVLDCFPPHDDIVNYGTNADERMVGRAALRSGVQRDPSQSPSIKFDLGWTHVGTSGNVAWVAGDVTIKVEMPDGQAMAFPARMTGVLQNYDGRWLVEQTHLSVPAPSQAEGNAF
ncbi:MAG: DUF4440 domain-containing protein [Chloroflexi bacterium]|nr:DUF4440 domain-containing protein [Chloroflexota bacterium]